MVIGFVNLVIVILFVGMVLSFGVLCFVVCFFFGFVGRRDS